mmetsp:Transcript_43380/g.108725  ORF Transcript_43380/g.108725 Transcript_43380/m.108725 type:complete len:221 (-) Transcript_43380:304-966(-)
MGAAGVGGGLRRRRFGQVQRHLGRSLLRCLDHRLPQGHRVYVPRGAPPHRVHADDQRLVRPRHRRHQRARQAHPLRGHLGERGHCADLGAPAGGPRARLRPRRVGRQRDPRGVPPVGVWVLHLVHLLGPPPQAQAVGVDRQLRAGGVLHLAPVVVRAVLLQPRELQPHGRRADHPLLAGGSRHRHRQRLQVDRGRQGYGPHVPPGPVWRRQGQVDLRGHD